MSDKKISILVKLVLAIIVISLILNTVSTIPFCGGTPGQNWLGFGACGYFQHTFNHLHGFTLFGREGLILSVHAFVIIALLVFLVFKRK